MKKELKQEILAAVSLELGQVPNGEYGKLTLEIYLRNGEPHRFESIHAKSVLIGQGVNHE